MAKGVSRRPRPRRQMSDVMWIRKCGQVVAVCCPEGTE